MTNTASDGFPANSSKHVGEGFIAFNHSHNGIVYQIGVNMNSLAIVVISAIILNLVYSLIKQIQYTKIIFILRLDESYIL